MKFSKYSTYEVHKDSVLKRFASFPKMREKMEIFHNIRLQKVHKLGVLYLHQYCIFANLYFITETCCVGFYDIKNNLCLNTFWKSMTYLCREYFIFLNSFFKKQKFRLQSKIDLKLF